MLALSFNVALLCAAYTWSLRTDEPRAVWLSIFLLVSVRLGSFNVAHPRLRVLEGAIDAQIECCLSYGLRARLSPRHRAWISRGKVEAR